MDIARGHIVIVSARGAYTGQPRPAMVVQAAPFTETHSNITVCPITTDCIDAPLFRVPLSPGERTGLRSASQIMIDKVVSVPRTSLVRDVGRCDDDTTQAVDDALRRWLAL